MIQEKNSHRLRFDNFSKVVKSWFPVVKSSVSENGQLWVPFLLLTLRTVNSTTPNPSLVRRGVSTTGLAGDIPRLSKEGLGVVVRKVSY